MSTAAVAPVVAVAFSGGRDSLALLHCTCTAARTLGLRVLALHVHHGLMPQADGWARSARALGRRWAARGWPLSVEVLHLPGAPGPGQSVEAWARAGRLAALSQAARAAGADLLLLAHHRQDQAETVLLQALRGGGPKGLSAMPARQWRQGLCWARPWIQQPRAAIEAYVQRHRLRAVEDPSNTDERLDRNRLRQRLWPLLIEAFPQAEAALVAVARQAQQADAAIGAWATEAVVACTAPQGGLARAPWLQLAVAQRAQVLAEWLRQQPAVRLTPALVDRLMAEWPLASAASWPAGRPGQALRHYRGVLTVVSEAGPNQPLPAKGIAQGVAARTRPGETCARFAERASSPAAGPRSLKAPSPDATVVVGGVVDLRVYAGCVGDVPSTAASGLRWDGGRLCLQPVASHGLPAASLQAVCLRARQGGERFALALNGLPRSLKKQYQARGVAASDRHGPLLCAASDGALLWAPGLGVDARHQADAGEPQWLPVWVPDRPGEGPGHGPGKTAAPDAPQAPCTAAEPPRAPGHCRRAR